MASSPFPNSLLFHKTFHSPAPAFRTWRVYAAQAPNNDRRRPPPGVDTRIHWQNEEEGWIGGKKKESNDQNNESNNMLGPSLADLLNNSSDSHYQ